MLEICESRQPRTFMWTGFIYHIVLVRSSDDNSGSRTSYECGARHWARVRHKGLFIARRSGANVQVVELFSFLHGSRRNDDACDPLHGDTATELFLELQGRFPPIGTSQSPTSGIGVPRSQYRTDRRGSYRADRLGRGPFGCWPYWDRIRLRVSLYRRRSRPSPLVQFY